MVYVCWLIQEVLSDTLLQTHKYFSIYLLETGECHVLIANCLIVRMCNFAILLLQVTHHIISCALSAPGLSISAALAFSSGVSLPDHK